MTDTQAQRRLPWPSSAARLSLMGSAMTKRGHQLLGSWNRLNAETMSSLLKAKHSCFWSSNNSHCEKSGKLFTSPEMTR